MAIAFLGWVAPACDLLTSPSDWTCEVTIRIGTRTVTGSGSGSDQDDALSRAWSNACSDLNLSGSELSRCQDGENPNAFRSWSARHSCETGSGS